MPTLDVNGNLFGGTEDDGTNSAGNVFELVPDGHGNWTNLDLFDFGYGQLYPYGRVVIGAVDRIVRERLRHRSVGGLMTSERYGSTK